MAEFEGLPEIADDIIERFIVALDLDRDDRLTEADIATFSTRMRLAIDPNTLHEMFQEADIRKDGYLDKDELCKTLCIRRLMRWKRFLHEWITLLQAFAGPHSNIFVRRSTSPKRHHSETANEQHAVQALPDDLTPLRDRSGPRRSRGHAPPSLPRIPPLGTQFSRSKAAEVAESIVNRSIQGTPRRTPRRDNQLLVSFDAKRNFYSYLYSTDEGRKYIPHTSRSLDPTSAPRHPNALPPHSQRVGTAGSRPNSRSFRTQFRRQSNEDMRRSAALDAADFHKDHMPATDVQFRKPFEYGDQQPEFLTSAKPPPDFGEPSDPRGRKSPERDTSPKGRSTSPKTRTRTLPKAMQVITSTTSLRTPNTQATRTPNTATHPSAQATPGQANPLRHSIAAPPTRAPPTSGTRRPHPRNTPEQGTPRGMVPPLAPLPSHIESILDRQSSRREATPRTNRTVSVHASGTGTGTGMTPRGAGGEGSGGSPQRYRGLPALRESTAQGTPHRSPMRHLAATSRITPLRTRKSPRKEKPEWVSYFKRCLPDEQMGTHKKHHILTPEPDPPSTAYQRRMDDKFEQLMGIPKPPPFRVAFRSLRPHDEQNLGLQVSKRFALL